MGDSRTSIREMLTGRILVVDDDAASLRMIGKALEQKGHTVAAATDGGTALDLMEQQDFDLVVSDIIMPGIDGLTMFETALANEKIKELPFVFLTADTKMSTKLKVLELGADGYITKPCSVKELYAVVARSLRLRVDNAPSIKHHDVVGKLEAWPAEELIDALSNGGKTGRLRVTSEYGESEVYLEKGKVVHADFVGIDGEEGVYLLFAVRSGHFTFDLNVTTDRRTVTANTQLLLLEGLRRMDETQALLAHREEAMKSRAQPAPEPKPFVDDVEVLGELEPTQPPAPAEALFSDAEEMELAAQENWQEFHEEPPAPPPPRMPEPAEEMPEPAEEMPEPAEEMPEPVEETPEPAQQAQLPRRRETSRSSKRISTRRRKLW